MILGESQTFASPGEAFEHFGVKGMRWGVRNTEERTPEQAAKLQRRKATAKKVAIGTGALLVVAGSVFVAHKTHQSGELPLSSLRSQKKPKTERTVKKFVSTVSEQTDLIHASRGRTQGFQFFRKGGFPDPYSEYAKAFGHDKFTDGLFERVGDKIAASFLDPDGRVDRAGRPITHQVLIPKSMTSGINSMKDVTDKIWPQIKDTYDPT